MDNEVSPERARQILDVLTQGGSMANINTPLALRLMPLAQELGERELVEQLLDHASSVASDVLEEGWTRFEAMKLMETPIGGYLRLAEDAEGTDGAEALAAAVHHHIALVYLSEGQLDEARATAQRALRLRQMTEDHQGMVYGMALVLLKDHAGQMEAIADLAHCQATIGEFNTAQDLFQQSLERATELGSLSGQLVARWGLADLAEIQQDYETAMLVLSDSLHEFIAADVPAPAQLRQRIKDLTELKDQPSDNAS